MHLLSASHIQKSYGSSVLLEDAELHVTLGERIGLVGVNGSGKSTLLAMLAGQDDPDSGEFAWRTGTRVAWLSQRPLLDEESSLRDVAMAGASRQRSTRETYERELACDQMLDALGLTTPSMRVAEASGGMRRRAALAAALLEEADVLLLDEPTNHLDLDIIAWLVRHLRGLQGALLMISHDRYFIDEVVDRVVEIRKQRLWSFAGDFGAYLEARQTLEGVEARAESNRRKTFESELEWLKRSPKARSTKQKARVDRVSELATSDWQPRQQVHFEVQQHGRLGKTILVASALRAGFPDRADGMPGPHVVADQLDLTMQPGARIGLIGPNGAGKTTLLRTFAGLLPPLAGEIRLGVHTAIVYIDQERSGLDAKMTVRESATPSGSDWVEVGGERVHVATWLDRFLFRGDDLRQPVSTLSGGQRFRLLLARRLQEPLNLLVLDEPTNDLDLETLAVLEQALVDYPGCLLVVSHDRCFLDRVCTAILHIPGDGQTELHAGGWSDWETRKRAASAPAAAAAGNDPSSARRKESAPPKITLAEKATLATIEADIERAEAAVGERETRLADPALMADHASLTAAAADLDAAVAKRDALYARWAELEEKLATWTAWRAGRGA